MSRQRECKRQAFSKILYSDRRSLLSSRQEAARRITDCLRTALTESKRDVYNQIFLRSILSTEQYLENYSEIELYLRKYRSLNKMSIVLFKLLSHFKGSQKTEAKYAGQLFKVWKLKVQSQKRLAELQSKFIAGS